MSSYKPVEFCDCTILKISNSGLAALISFPDKEEPVWIPVSQIHDDSEVWKEGDSGKLSITEWIATQKGLI